MKRLFFIIFFFILFLTAYLFNFSQKTYAASLCQTNGTFTTCSSSGVTWRCPTSWVCACYPAYAYAYGGSRCTKSTTYNYPVGAFLGSDGKYTHTCWFASLVPFNRNCGPYTAPSLSATTSCSATYQSQVKFTWTAVKNATSYKLKWTGGSVSTTSTSRTVVVPNNTSISWSITPCNEAGCFDQSSSFPGGVTAGPTVTSKTCVAPTPNCNSGITCGGCNLSSGTCGSGSKTCTYTTLSGGGTCNPVAAPSQSCSIGCGTGQVCTNNQCVSSTPNCNSGITCGGCSPTTGSCGGGSKSCSYTTYSGGGTCKPVSAPSQSCSVGCAAGETCTNNQCVLPSCPTSHFSGFAPELPTGGICMLNRIIGTLLSVLLYVSLLFALVFLIWGGIDWITSGGDKQRVAKARQKITFAIIGFFVALAAFAILHFVYSYFKISY